MILDPRLNIAPIKVQNIYLMGIGGVAMGAIANGLKSKGFTVQGSDRTLYPPMSLFLEEKGIKTFQGYARKNLYYRPDLVIVGNVIRKDNPEVQALADLKIPYLSLPQALAHFFIKDKVSIVVSGTHGKTTSTAILAEGLERAGFNPGFMVGGLLAQTGRNFQETTGNHFVVEGDEYDTAFFDKRPKFVHYRPQIAILTSCEFDHADIYEDFNAVKRAFNSLTTLIPEKGCLIAFADSPEVLRRTQKAKCKVLTYGRSKHASWRLKSLCPSPKGGAELEIVMPDQKILQVFSPLSGEHNALNMTAAIAAMVEAKVDPKLASKVQEQFGGVRRRQEIRGKAKNITVVDDFAHHPTAVLETINGVKQFGLPGHKPGSGRLVAVFEPRTNTSKQNIFQEQYANSFDQADLVFLREPPDVQGLSLDKRFSSAKLCEDLKKKGLKAFCFENTDALLKALKLALQPHDLCLIMSNGGFDNIHQRLLRALKDEV